MPTQALPHYQSTEEERQLKINGQLQPYFNQYIWISMATLFGLPATVMPITHAENELPIGIQIIGDYLEDNTTLEFAKLLERELGGFKKPRLD